MGNIYSAQNIAAYFIYGVNEKGAFINSASLHRILTHVDNLWHQIFGHTALKERTIDLDGYFIVKEVEEAYEEFGDDHLLLPAKEWHLQYGQFQLVRRTYGVPAFTSKEMLIVSSVLNKYLKSTVRKAS